MCNRFHERKPCANCGEIKKLEPNGLCLDCIKEIIAEERARL